MIIVYAQMLTFETHAQAYPPLSGRTRPPISIGREMYGGLSYQDRKENPPWNRKIQRA